jgi:hypothetical protein
MLEAEYEPLQFSQKKKFPLQEKHITKEQVFYLTYY